MGPLLVYLFIHIHFWFFLALLKKRNDIADIAWGLGFIALATIRLVTQEAFALQNFVVYALVLAWGLRLSIYIFLRSRRSSEDPRYRAMRTEWGSSWPLQTYAKVFWLQSLLMAIIALPLYFLLGQRRQFEALNIPFLALALLGLAIELLADKQKAKFRKNPLNSGSFIDEGLWKFARHPNYGGEILFWWGLSGFSLPQLTWVWAGPALLTFLLLKVSGVPLAEKLNSSKPGYREYKSRTRLLFPLPKLQK